MMTMTAAEALDAYEAARHRLPPAGTAQGRATPAARLTDLADRFDAFLLDAFGVLNVGETVIPGAPESVAALQAMGKRVLVTGCGPIGQLAVLVARAAGAVSIVATDVTPFTLTKAQEVGADATHNVATEDEPLAPYAADKGTFDVLFECSGVAVALAGAVPAMRPGAIVMQLGLGGDMTLPMQAMTAKELDLRGSFRFHAEFSTAVEMMKAGRLDVKPLITHSFPVDEAVAAFDMASDRSQAIKAQIAFS